TVRIRGIGEDKEKEFISLLQSIVRHAENEICLCGSGRKAEQTSPALEVRAGQGGSVGGGIANANRIARSGRETDGKDRHQSVGAIIDDVDIVHENAGWIAIDDGTNGYWRLDHNVCWIVEHSKEGFVRLIHTVAQCNHIDELIGGSGGKLHQDIGAHIIQSAYSRIVHGFESH